MKNFSILAAFVFAVLISSTAFAATWTQIDVGNMDDLGADAPNVYVDKSSIKRGVQCAALNVNRTDGFTANIKVQFIFSDNDSFEMINTMGFFEDNGAKKKCYIVQIDENGNPVKDDSFKPEISAADGTDGDIWPKVYDYIRNNLP